MGYAILAGFWFWLAFFFVVALIIYEIEEDSGAGTTAVAVVGSVALWYFTGGTNPLPWLSQHWAELLGYLVLYIIVGAGWGIAKWWFYLHNKGDEYEEQRANYQKAWTDATPSFKAGYGDDYKTWIANKGYPPAFLEHKADFTMWMVWWPFSAFWTLLNDPLKRIYRMIVQHLGGMLTRMSNAVFANRFTELK